MATPQPLTQIIPTNAPSTNSRARLLLLGTLLVVGTIAGIVWSQRSQTSPAAGALPIELRDEPDLYVDDAVIRQYATTGQLRYRLLASTINHFETDGLTRLRDPKLTLYGADGAPTWRATANYGYIRERPGPDGTPEEVVFLRESVALTKQVQLPSHLLLTSDSLYLYLAREYVETNEDATISSNFGYTKASAMRGNLATGILHLSAKRSRRADAFSTSDGRQNSISADNDTSAGRNQADGSVPSDEPTDTSNDPQQPSQSSYPVQTIVRPSQFK